MKYSKGIRILYSIIVLTAATVLSCSGGSSSDSGTTAYVVTYNANGATGGVVPVDGTEYETGQSIIVLGNTGNLVKSGNCNMVWNTKADGTGTSYTEGQSFLMESENVVLYARWTDFITTWKTDNTGTTGENQIAIWNYSGETYDYFIDWGDGTNNTGVTGSITHTYDSPGTYTVSISGTFPGIFFGDLVDHLKILTIENWGTICWERMDGAFYNCENLIYNAADIPDLSQVTDMTSMFHSAASFNGNISGWDVSNVTDMSYMFDGATAFNQDIGSWNVGNVADMSHMFNGASAFNQDIGSWNVSNVTDMSNIFSSAQAFNHDIGSWNVGKVTDMRYMFFCARAFNQDIGSWDVGNVTNMRYMFNQANAFNQDIGSWNVGKVTNMNSMFYMNHAFNQDIASWNVSNVTDMSSMFYRATAFSNHDLSGWNVAKVTAHGYFSFEWGTGNTEPVWP